MHTTFRTYQAERMSDIEISVVTGTYNRLNFLQNLVESIRTSISNSAPYEIVIVDGGSKDGTIKWCKEQLDIVLIEHKKLLGAVKAFNDGARAARGRYVILANDDIEFLSFSIMAAYTFMQDSLKVGIGCFYQDRNKRGWHVERMSAIVNGKYAAVHYGQVCIIPRWLGDEVGWWGDYLHTYGGDNELSCNVWQLGYPVLPAPCTYITDYTPQDELRKINNEDVMQQGTHPDTQAWINKWSHGKVNGPIVKNEPDDPIYLERKYRIMYLPIYEPGHKIQYETKRGLRDALERRGMVLEWDYMNKPLQELPDAACAFDPDLFVTQLHDADTVTSDMITHLKRQHPRAAFVNWNGDYHPETLMSSEYILLTKKFDWCGFVTTAMQPEYDEAGVNWFYWQIGYEEEINPGKYNFPSHDVVFLANAYSRARLDLAQQLRSVPGLDLGIYGSWPKDIGARGQTLYDFDAGYDLYRKCKIAIGDSQWPHAGGFVSNRLFQAMAAGAFVLHQSFRGMEELLGLEDGVHLVTWKDALDLQGKIAYWLYRKDGRDRIAKAGQDYVLKHHSFDARVDELFERMYA
jgi:glycosyltransferase involved in cell wall biosynthesis